MHSSDLRTLLAARGIVVQAVRELTTGQKNTTLLVEAHGGRFVVRQYATATPDEIEYELAAVEHLAGRGFPTPAPLRDSDGNLAGSAGGWLAAVFAFAGGAILPILTRCRDRTWSWVCRPPPSPAACIA